MRPVETTNPAPAFSAPIAGPGMTMTRRCDACRTIKPEGPDAQGRRWRFVNRLWWHCPACAPQDEPRTRRKAVAQAATEAVANDAAQRPFRIRSLADLKAWCRVDAASGCWHWTRSRRKGDELPAVRYIDPRSECDTVHNGRRAALNLARKQPVPASHIAWAKAACLSLDCVNPAHAMSGTRAQRGAYLRQHGLSEVFREVFTPMLREFAARRRVITPQQAVELRRRMVEGGETAAALAREFGISRSVMSLIKLGKRPCDQGVRGKDRAVARNASVFALAASLAGETACSNHEREAA
ncbi:hypothetical protein [Azohydromonas aeria]|uniref:hypothetical protein n=1 Tax=Azohydromonas aeria TaxID=2590212 RepID=UPI0012FC5FD8|nr:hypothetical protein [Azohydromonas aeria]